jgi:putative transposase
VNTVGQREAMGLRVGACEAEPSWTEFLRSLNRRGLQGVKLVISNRHEGIKAATAKVLKATTMRWDTTSQRARLKRIAIAADLPWRSRWCG